MSKTGQEAKRRSRDTQPEPEAAYIVGRDERGGMSVRKVRVHVVEEVEHFGPELADIVLAWLERDLMGEVGG